jgi:hypothetical protein
MDSEKEVEQDNLEASEQNYHIFNELMNSGKSGDGFTEFQNDPSLIYFCPLGLLQDYYQQILKGVGEKEATMFYRVSLEEVLDVPGLTEFSLDFERRMLENPRIMDRIRNYMCEVRVALKNGYPRPPRPSF